jgi:hypothetical protein
MQPWINANKTNSSLSLTAMTYWLEGKSSSFLAQWCKKRICGSCGRTSLTRKERSDILASIPKFIARATTIERQALWCHIYALTTLNCSGWSRRKTSKTKMGNTFTLPMMLPLEYPSLRWLICTQPMYLKSAISTIWTQVSTIIGSGWNSKRLTIKKYAKNPDMILWNLSTLWPKPKPHNSQYHCKQQINHR